MKSLLSPARCLLFALVGIGLLVPAPCSAAPVIIDTFDTPNPWATFGGGSGPGILRGPESGAGILGTRTLAVGPPGLLNGGDFIGIGTANSGTLTGEGVLEVGQGGMSDFTVALRYTNFGTQDFSGDLALALDIFAFNNGSLVTETTFTLSTATGNLVSTPQMFPNIPPGPMTFLVPFSAFSGPGSLSQVTGIGVSFNSNNSAGLDLALDTLRVTSIPEPASLAVWGLLGAGAVWYSRRRMKCKPAVA